MSSPRSGLIAILRGITPDEVVAVGEAVMTAGFAAVEIPLNSPDPFTSITRLRDALGPRAAVGAGTVLTVEDVGRAQAAGASIIVAPNTDPEVIRAATGLDLRCYPGVATATEAFAAYRAGARHVKIFPSQLVGVAGMVAWRAVLPPAVELVPVGGVDEHDLADWARAGAGGAGLGSTLYRAGDTPAAVAERARVLRAAWDAGASTIRSTPASTP